MAKVDKWMGQFNTTTQSLNKWLSTDFNARLKNYLNNLFTILVGDIKLHIALDQRVILQDNHLIDSGFIRALFKFRYDSELDAKLRQMKELMLNFSDHFLYVHDNRITNNRPESLVIERFNLTANSEYIHSASFGNENWRDIENADKLKKDFPEYGHIFRFLTEFVESIPSENILSNPQKRGIYVELLRTEYDNNKDKYQDYLSTLIRMCLDNYSSDKKTLDRSDLYAFFSEELGSREAELAKRLIADKVYNCMVPEGLKTRNYRVNMTELATIFLGQEIELIYKRGNKDFKKENKGFLSGIRKSLLGTPKNDIHWLDLTDDDCLRNKHKSYLLIESLAIEDIKLLRSHIRKQRNLRIGESEIVRQFLSGLYKIGRERTLPSIVTSNDISASINVLSQDPVSTVIPVRSVTEKLTFLYTRHFSSDGKELANIVDKAMSGK